MGVAISSLHRLRSQFLIKLFKKGLVGQSTTIQSLFESRGKMVDDVHVIPKSELYEILGEDSIAILKELFNKCRFSNDCIPVNFIVDFLEHGIFNASTRETVKKQMDDQGIYSEVWKLLCLKTSSDEEEEEDSSTDLILFEGSTTRSRKNLAKKDKKKGQQNIVDCCRSVWKKHETVIQEKIVKHVTVDEDGNINELITTDKSQNDIIHIESKTTGEFAHREYTQQEQTETMDNDMSTFIRATEEYIHLKSTDDEYEYLHSEVPATEEQESESDYVDPHRDDHEEAHDEEELIRDVGEVEYS